MEQEIAQALALAVRLLSEAVILTEAETSQEPVIFINEAFERLSGYSLEELRGPGLRLLQGLQTDSAALEALLSASHSGEQGSRDILFYRKNGIPFWDRVTTSGFEIVNKAFHIQMHRDVTREKVIEQQLVPIQRHEARSHLISGLTHDFNNLLTAIQVYCGLLAAKVKGEAQLQRYVDEIHISAERASQLVGQLQSLGRQDSAPLELVDLKEVVKENGELLRRALGDDIQLNIDADGGLNKVKANPARIQQILLNLAITAREVMPNGGEMLVRLTNDRTIGAPAEKPFAARKSVLLLVRNTGAGIDTERLTNVARSFFNAIPQSNNTELRLFVVSMIVEQYGGTIDLEVETGKSARVNIMLPAQ